MRREEKPQYLAVRRRRTGSDTVDPQCPVFLSSPVVSPMYKLPSSVTHMSNGGEGGERAMVWLVIERICGSERDDHFMRAMSLSISIVWILLMIQVSTKSNLCHFSSVNNKVYPTI